MKEIKLSQIGKNKGKYVALVDDEDYDVLNQFKWYATKQGNTLYAKRNITVDGKHKKVRMHCAIMNRKSIDHRDGDGLNNQKSNLRFCTRSENGMNRIKHKSMSSIYKGVSLNKPNGKWIAHIKINGKVIHLGYFFSEVDAAMAYNKKAISLFCEFANLNNICYYEKL